MTCNTAPAAAAVVARLSKHAQCAFGRAPWQAAPLTASQATIPPEAAH